MKAVGSDITKLLTFEEFERLPDQPGKRELLEGDLIELPPAEFEHNRIAHQIYEMLKAAVIAVHARGEAAELGDVYHEMGYKLAKDAYLQPDVSVTHRAQDVSKYLSGAPAIAIEVVSPSNTAVEMEAKTALYFRYGAREVWRIYRKTRHVVVHVGSTSRALLEDESLTTPLLPGVASPCARCWDKTDRS
ncbi:MAG TPA: Uma2 family endonuclease [Bryobacteraceae bacterium]|nr:Uma2 family endonuclease [Bryobacteraceae bacterium]